MYERAKKIYWPMAFLTVVYLCAVYAYTHFSGTIAQPEELIALQSIGVLATLIGIPLILKLYNNVKIKEEDPHSENMAKWTIIRWSALLAIIFINGNIYLMVGSASPLICAFIACIFLIFFCKPE